MNNLFTFLTLFSIIGLIVGLIKPSWVKMKTRKQTFEVFGCLTILFFVLFGVTSPTPATPIDSNNTQQKQTEPTQAKQDNSQNQVKPSVQQVPQQAPKEKSFEEKITEAVNGSLGANTNTNKPRTVGVEIEKYNAKMLSEYKYKSNESIVGVLIKINADENLTTNLQKGTMDDEASKIAQAVFPIDQSIGDIIIWSQLPVKDQYGNIKDDTAIVFSISRSLFDKINWGNFSHRDLPALLNSESSVDDRNSYFEKIRFN